MLKATQQAPLWIEEIGAILELLEAKRAAWSIWPRVVNNWLQIAILPEGLLWCSSWSEDAQTASSTDKYELSLDEWYGGPISKSREGTGQGE